HPRSFLCSFSNRILILRHLQRSTLEGTTPPTLPSSVGPPRLPSPGVWCSVRRRRKLALWRRCADSSETTPTARPALPQLKGSVPEVGWERRKREGLRKPSRREPGVVRWGLVTGDAGRLAGSPEGRSCLEEGRGGRGTRPAVDCAGPALP
uniref:Uncharacterized protein n=1 Tax=Naja naja TaxID=35670 RepID=A0A8C6X2T3_NAJNA